MKLFGVPIALSSSKFRLPVIVKPLQPSRQTLHKNIINCRTVVMYQHCSVWYCMFQCTLQSGQINLMFTSVPNISLYFQIQRYCKNSTIAVFCLVQHPALVNEQQGIRSLDRSKEREKTSRQHGAAYNFFNSRYKTTQIVRLPSKPACFSFLSND